MKNFLVTLLGVFIGVYLTYFLMHNNFYSINAVCASSLTGILASLAFIKKYNLPTSLGIAMYCGSFAGMGAVLGAENLILTSLIITCLIFLTKEIFKGFGGKLGITAYIASIITHFVIIYANDTSKLSSISNLFTSFKPITNNISIICIIISSLIGFYITTYLNHKINKSAVFASAVPSFIIGLLMLSELPINYTSLIATTFFSASFAGMLANGLLRKSQHPIIILIHIATVILFKSNLGKYGGALGTMAFLAVLLSKRFEKILDKK